MCDAMFEAIMAFLEFSAYKSTKKNASKNK